MTYSIKALEQLKHDLRRVWVELEAAVLNVKYNLGPEEDWVEDAENILNEINDKYFTKDGE
jgi:hypothetical protein